ncbi:uncharacterized protein [Aristolochia californica]|uniref:uncharacterized protein n=1 Tax=Aristolochia californica TaxID=171875 RepID=UPI0035D9427C
MGKRWFKLKKMSKESWPWRFHIPPVWRWKRLDFQLSILDDVLFKIVSIVEAILLVSVLCFFFLCCGCHI